MSSFNWQDLKLTSQFIRAVDDLGWATPTLVQKKCIPQILAGQKVIGIAQTGTGKTAAYLLPILSKLKYAQHNDSRALILAPTKELVIQIASDCKELSKHTDLRVVELYGGVGPRKQKELLNGGSDIIISTPGRFLELYRSGSITTKFIKTFVIDEADRMMDMHFMPQIRSIQELLPSKRQDLLFSATFSSKVERMAQEFIDFPMRIEVTPQASIVDLIKQELYLVPNFQTKVNLLHHLLSGSTLSRVIIFCRTKRNVTLLETILTKLSVGSIKTIHSNKSQNSRINSIQHFRQGSTRILISTDVASRGIDISEVSHVINFDVPILYEEYIHRIGRTGRANNEGTAITFSTPADLYHIEKIESLIGEKIHRKNIPVEVNLEETPFSESQTMLREIDRQKRIEDPNYRGAFHDKKK